MNSARARNSGLRVLAILIVTLPLLMLFLAPLYPPLLFTLWFWMILVALVGLIWALTGTRARARTEAVTDQSLAKPAVEDEALPVMLNEAAQDPAVREVMDVKVATRERGIEMYEGRLFGDAQQAFGVLWDRLRGTGKMPVLQEAQGGRVGVTLIPRPASLDLPTRSNPAVHWGLFALTLVTTTIAGAVQQGISILHNPGAIAAGLPYSIALLAILGLHELGHFYTARYHRMSVTPPFFIPVPFALGTFGAFIQLRSPAPRRTALFDVAVAGPLAGLVVAIPALLFGLRLSGIGPGLTDTTNSLINGTNAGSSLLLGLIAHFALGDKLQQGASLVLHPLAFAGWLGLLITALNLIPIGQLDGGHIAHAMFGRRTASAIGSVALWALFLLALFVVPGLLLWVLIVYFIAGTRDAPALEDISPITPGRMAVGVLSFIILLMIVLPMPIGLQSMLGM